MGEEFDAKPWASALRRAQAGAHAGMAEEWADLCVEARADTWDDAQAVVRELVRRYKLDNPGCARAVTPGQCAGYLDHARDLMARRRRAVAEAPASPAAPPPPPVHRETTDEARARRLRGELSPIERILIERNQRSVGVTGDLIPIGA